MNNATIISAMSSTAIKGAIRQQETGDRADFVQVTAAMGARVCRILAENGKAGGAELEQIDRLMATLQNRAELGAHLFNDSDVLVNVTGPSAVFVNRPYCETVGASAGMIREAYEEGFNAALATTEDEAFAFIERGGKLEKLMREKSLLAHDAGVRSVNALLFSPEEGARASALVNEMAPRMADGYVADFQYKRNDTKLTSHTVRTPFGLEGKEKGTVRILHPREGAIRPGVADLSEARFESCPLGYLKAVEALWELLRTAAGTEKLAQGAQKTFQEARACAQITEAIYNFGGWMIRAEDENGAKLFNRAHAEVFGMDGADLAAMSAEDYARTFYGSEYSKLLLHETNTRIMAEKGEYRFDFEAASQNRDENGKKIPVLASWHRKKLPSGREARVGQVIKTGHYL